MQHFTIIITAYNCRSWIGQCIDSAINQLYPDYDIIVIDAASTDGTMAIIHKYWAKNRHRRFIIHQNFVRRYQTQNIYTAVHMAMPGTICVSLDGDDWLKHSRVLQALNEVYAPDVWLTYGSYEHNNGIEIPPGRFHRYPDHVIKENSYRHYEHQLFTHLRTWRRELFLKIREDSFKKDNRWAWNSGDCFFGYPMLEMAAERQQFVDEILYVYNRDNPLSDDRVNNKEQLDLADYAKSLTPYQRIEKLGL